jgi:hypothetical protein
MTKTPSRVLHALLIAAGLAVAAVPSQAATKPSDEAASAPAQGARPETSAAIKGAMDAAQAKDWVGVLAKLKEVEAVGNLNSYETYLVTRLRAAASYNLHDNPTVITNAQALLKMEQLPASDRPAFMEVLIYALYDEKRYPEVLATIADYQKAGGTKQDILDLVPKAQYLSGDNKSAAGSLQKQIDAEIAAGKVPSERDLRLLYSAQDKGDDEAGAASTVERMAEYYPKPEFWADVVQRAGHAPGTEKLRLDAVRLRSAVLGYRTGLERLQHANLAMQGGYPAEAKPLYDEGINNKLFSATEMPEAIKSRDIVTKSIAQDRAADKANETAARKATDGDALVVWGLEVFFDGQADKGIALMEEGIRKGNLKHAAEDKLHLGMAYVRVGRLDDARKLLDPIAGTEGVGALAHAWSLWAKVGAKFIEEPKKP